jgi:cytoskeletal protein CcmA (bactofilin family)
MFSSRSRHGPDLLILRARVPETGLAIHVQTGTVLIIKEEPPVWNKRPEDGPGPRTPAPEAPRPPAAAAPVQSASRAEPAPPARQIASIGSSMFIRGDIRSAEELLVDGEVEGSLESHSLITVGTNGKVRANIKAREVVIFGCVDGNIEASEKIAIREQGSLKGDIKTAGISIDDGAYFKGSIDIVRPDTRVNSKPARSQSQSHPQPRAETTAVG